MNIKVGDTVTRMLAGEIPMSLKVSKITDEIIFCGPWKFDRSTGAEIDEDLNWNQTGTGSYLKEIASP